VKCESLEIWPGAGDSPVLLAENRLLAVSVDCGTSPPKSGRRPTCRSSWGARNLCVRSLLGYIAGKYPERAGASRRIAKNCNRCGARGGPAILAGAMLLGVVGGLFATLVLAGDAVCRAGVVTGLLSPTGSFEFCAAVGGCGGAALMPGALLMVGALSFYDLGVMDLVQLIFVFGAHLVVGWVYFAVSPFFLPRVSEVVPGAKNPFAARK
jgi:hypothetical protein